MDMVFPNVYTFAVQGTSYGEAQNVEIIATSTTRRLNETDFEQLVSSSHTVKIQAMNEYVTNYFVASPNNSPILTDDYAPVENLISPITGLPLTQDQQPFITQSEALRVAAGVILVAAVCLILAKRRLLR